MFRSYLNIALRNFKRQKAYSIINITGLAIGICCFAMLTLFVKEESSFDKFHAKSDKTFRLLSADTSKAEITYQQSMAGGVAEVLLDQVPDLEQVFRVGTATGKVVTVGEKRFLGEAIYLTDSGFFESIDFSLINGDFRSVRLGPNDILLSRKEAERLYGFHEDYVGQTLSISDFHEFVVKGVYELPENTIFQFNYLISFYNVGKAYGNLLKYFPKENRERMLDWGLVAFSTYLVTPELIEDSHALESKINLALSAHWTNDISKIEPLPEVYFSEVKSYQATKSGDRKYLNLFMLIAVVILLIAIINYMNMSTARHTKRAKEVGIRKTVGGSKKGLLGQFFIESIFMTATATLLAICLLEIMLPSFSAMTDRNISINYLNPLTLLTITGFILTIGTLAGIYPAFVLSKFKAIDILNGKLTRGKGGLRFRQVLVSFQFIVCIGLFAVTLIVSLQFRFLSDFNLGYDAQQLITVPLKDKNMVSSYQSFKSELLRNPKINSVTGTSFSMSESPLSLFRKIDGLEEEMSVGLMNVEKDFVDNLGLEILEGKNFDRPENIIGNQRVLINETAAKMFKWDDPVGRRLQGESDDDPKAHKVLGVLKDFIFDSPKKELMPVTIYATDKGFSHAVVKVEETNIKETLRQMEEVFDQFSNEYPFEYSFVDADFSAKMDREKRLSRIFTAFSVLAVFIAALGLFGLSLFMAEQKIKEIGIRKVLGASITDIVWLLNHSVTRLIFLSGLIALPIAYNSMNKWLEEFPYHIELHFWYFLIPLATMLLISLVTMAYQSLKSARTNPVQALRTE